VYFWPDDPPAPSLRDTNLDNSPACVDVFVLAEASMGGLRAARRREARRR